LFSHACDVLKNTPEAISKKKMEFIKLPVGTSCKPGDGYLDGPSGKRDNVADCEELCSTNADCRSFTFFRNNHCSLFKHACDDVKDTPEAISKKKT